jgi:3-hydroxy-5-phosphonooxypentane-2,4-dione thiolase
MFDHMSWGKRNRIHQIVNSRDNHCLMLAIDQGYFMGLTHGMEMPREDTTQLIPHIDSLMLSPGILTSCIDPGWRGVGWVLRATGANSVLDEDIDDEG